MDTQCNGTIIDSDLLLIDGHDESTLVVESVWVRWTALADDLIVDPQTLPGSPEPRGPRARNKI
jgi:hypothetical protein